MSREWKPGDVALVHGRVCMRLDNSWEHGDPRAFRFADGDALDARPLVVIDPEDAEQVTHLLRLYWRDADGDEADDVTNYPDYIRDMSAALREFASPTPPKPDEPQGLGAVVEDAEGRRWTNTHCVLAWLPQDGQPRRYADIDAVRVLSEGVTA